ncbi:hypothetical protein EDB81DRAFT_828322 [Dactylonectria macrodidyma]|uniref:Myosin motor domain-containing protein n=1 Tax=Dactylonectria macrodidyma TaxID=307937 RepID=A0A9P9D3Y7_9HYPO|nr:hypothetical protein EDB81DRAFT_828322 [Dactylonectria macrodidyma]
MKPKDDCQEHGSGPDCTVLDCAALEMPCAAQNSNEAKEAWKFEGPMVLSQLRACGVLETVRIS